ncbi:MAG TPA: transporter [Chryseolinea sp.]|nr:transporter [Chryseolinea sp.]
MKTLVLALATSVTVISASAHEADSIPRKGSYLYYGQPAIEDNSMLIEEAFNQEAGIIQHISNFVFNDGNFAYNYTQEIPLADVKHQLSFGVSYASLKKPSEIADLTHSYISNGLGDIFINYRPLLWGKNAWALVIPRFSLIVPTGNSRYGLGSGSWGGQFNLAVTKRLGSKITTHYNAGYTLMTKADHYAMSSDGQPTLLYERNMSTTNFGASAIWLVATKFNFMLEFVTAYGKEMQDDGLLTHTNTAVLNPGFRFAIDIGKVQIVPGAGVPFNFANGKYEATGGFIYLSIEPAY